MNTLPILAVDDDQSICRLIELYLGREMFPVEVCHNGSQALEIFRKAPFSLVVLDVMLPGMDGFQVCREIRRISTTPVIMLTAKGSDSDKMLGRYSGADDYIVKPFDPQELTDRVKTVLRCYQPSHSKVQHIAYQDLNINLAAYIVRLKGCRLELEPGEIELLYFLASHPNKVFTRAQLLEQVWGCEFLADSQTIDVHINHLRQKLYQQSDAWELKAVWDIGYKFELAKSMRHGGENTTILYANN